MCFTDDLVSGEVIYDRDSLQCLVDAAGYDSLLMNRLLELNPLKSLTYVDPLLYDNGRLSYNSDVSPASCVQTESTGILLQLISRFMSESEKGVQRPASERIEKVARYVTSHLSEPISVDDLSILMCVSTDHFSRIFKKITGESPSKYIRRRRIERAQHLLLTSDMPISRIAEEVGIPNLSQFTRLFSGFCGCPPKFYRSRHPEIAGFSSSIPDGPATD